VASFEDAIRIYALKDDVKAFNHYRLQQLRRPVLLVIASHTGGSAAEDANTDEGGNLHKDILISINARIMLRENLWVERILFNGSMGTVRDIVWEVGADYEKDPPLALLIDFDDYDQSAPSLVTDPESGRVLVPIFRVKRDWVKGTVHCTRTQFPLAIAYAITIHKSQGLSVDRAVLNPGKKKDFAPGLSYVAISRVRSLPGIMFEEPFDFNRLKSRMSDITIMRAADAARRLQQEVPLPTEEDEEDLPSFQSELLGPGRASQMELPILPSEPVQPSGQLYSTITIPSGFDILTSMDLSSDVVSQQPLLQYVAGLVPINPGQYAGTALMASQDSTQNESFECRASSCDRDRIPAMYRAVPGADVCIWCNNGLNADDQRRKVWCQGVGRASHEIYKHVKGDETFCPGCEMEISA
jgi:hypothetical protein